MESFTAISSPHVHAAPEQEVTAETLKIAAERVLIQQTKDLTQVAQRAAAVDAGEAGLAEVLTLVNHAQASLAAMEATLEDETAAVATKRDVLGQVDTCLDGLESARHVLQESADVASAVVNRARASVLSALTPRNPNESVPRDRKGDASSQPSIPSITDSLKRASSLLAGHDLRRELAEEQLAAEALLEVAAATALSTWVTPRNGALPLQADQHTSVEAVLVRAATDGTTPSDASTVAARVFESEPCALPEGNALATPTPDFAAVAQRLSDAARATRELFHAHVTAVALAEGAQEVPVRTDDTDDQNAGRESTAVASEHVSAASTRTTTDLSQMLDKALLLVDDVAEQCRVEFDLREEAGRDAERAVAVHSELQAATQRTSAALAALADATEAAAAAVETLRADQAARDATAAAITELEAQVAQQQNAVASLEREAATLTEESAKLDALMAQEAADFDDEESRAKASIRVAEDQLTATRHATVVVEEDMAKAEAEHAAMENDTARLSQEGSSLLAQVQDLQALVEENTSRLLNAGHTPATALRRKRSREGTASEQSSPEFTVEEAIQAARAADDMARSAMEAREAQETEEVAAIRARAAALEAAALTFATPARAASMTALPAPAATDDDAPLSNAEVAL